MHSETRVLPIRIMGLLMALMLVAASCGNDKDGDGALGEVSPGVDEGHVEEPAEEEPAEEEPAEDEPAEEEPAEEEPAEEEPAEEEIPVELPASFRGVTADTIRVGVSMPDFDALAALGVPNYHGSYEIAMQAHFDRVNADGGIFGRQVEPVYVTFDFTRPTSMEEACIKLTEDDQVFIVLNGMLSDENLCLTDLHDTMVMTPRFLTEELRQRSGDTLWLNLAAADDASAAIMAATLAQGGYLDGKTIGVVNYGEIGTTAPVEEVLAELGFETVAATFQAPPNDLNALDAEGAIVAERFRSEGVDFVFDLGGGALTSDPLINNGLDVDWAFSSLGGVLGGTAFPEAIDGALSVASPSLTAIFLEDPEFQEICKDPIIEANPDLAEAFETVPAVGEEGPDNPNWHFPTYVACNQVRLLKALGELAGAELTNDSFKAAVDELGEFKLPGLGSASFRSADKWDGNDTFEVQQYNHATGTIETIGEPVTVVR